MDVCRYHFFLNDSCYLAQIDVLWNRAAHSCLKLEFLHDQAEFCPATLSHYINDTQKKKTGLVGCSDSFDQCHFLPIAIWWMSLHGYVSVVLDHQSVLIH